MTSDTQAIRERAERLKRVLINYSNREADEHDVANIADEIGLAVCTDLLAALDREKVLEAEVAKLTADRQAMIEAALSQAELANGYGAMVAKAEARLATLQQQNDDLKAEVLKWSNDFLESEVEGAKLFAHAEAMYDALTKNMTVWKQHDAYSNYRAAFPAT